MTSEHRWDDPFRRKPDPRATATRHRGRLLAMSGVVSVGIGFDAAHRTVIVVGVASREDAEGPGMPSDLDGVPVEVRVVGDLSARAAEGGGEEPSPGKK